MYLRAERLFRLTLWSGGLSGIFCVSLILFFLIIESFPAFDNINFLRFFSDKSWHPLEGEFNLLPMLVGSLLISATAVIISVPLATGCAIYLVFYISPWLQSFSFRLLEVLGGIPSVIFGLWGILTVVPLISRIQGPGTSLLAGAIVVAMMIIPGLALMFSLALKRGLEQNYVQAISLGLNKEQSIWRIILPSSLHSMGGALVLQSTRAIGETMAVLMVCGNIAQIPDSVFDPVRTLTTNTALEMAYATGDHRSALFVSGLVLTFFVAGLLLLLATSSLKEKSTALDLQRSMSKL